MRPLLPFLLLLSFFSPTPCSASSSTSTRTLSLSLSASFLPTLSKDCNAFSTPRQVARCERQNACLLSASALPLPTSLRGLASSTAEARSAPQRAACAIDCFEAKGNDGEACRKTHGCLLDAPDEEGRMECVCAALPSADKPECRLTTACVRRSVSSVDKKLCGIGCLDAKDSRPESEAKKRECVKVRACLGGAKGDHAVEQACFDRVWVENGADIPHADSNVALNSMDKFPGSLSAGFAPLPKR